MCATRTRDERTKTSQNALLAGLLGLINNIGASVADGLLEDFADSFSLYCTKLTWPEWYVSHQKTPYGGT